MDVRFLPAKFSSVFAIKLIELMPAIIKTIAKMNCGTRSEKLRVISYTALSCHITYDNVA